MILSRNSFFGILFLVIISPFPLYKLVWLLRSTKTTGTMFFTGHGNLGSVLGTSTYPVIRFQAGHDTLYFNGNVNIPLKEGQVVPVRFQRKDPTDAKIDVFSCIWGDTVAYELAPFLIFLVILFHPDLVPKKSKVVLGGKPFIHFPGG
jgi:hypothetical protein